jgi:molybdate transport system substrate-binding protein
VLAKVTSGEADAGLVYASDARAAGDDVLTIPVPGAEEALTTYLIAVVERSDDPDLAGAWVDLVLSPDGQGTLEDAGFGPAEGQ